MPIPIRMAAALSAGTLMAVLVLIPDPSSEQPHLSHAGVPDTVDTDWPECPHTWDVIQVRDSSKRRSDVISLSVTGGLSVPGPTTNIPEFHDCQRIIKEDGQYGPLMAVFAAADLSERTFEAQHTTRESLTTFAAAEVVNLSADYSYQPLGIEPLFNCLYVYRLPGEPLRAKMIPVGPQERACGRAINPIIATGKDLSVRETLKGMYDPSEIPAVARWDWDRRHREQYIGLRCGNAWCEVGRPAEGSKPEFVSSPPYLTPPGPGPIDGPRRVRAIKGWYDQQVLAVDHGLSVRPGLIRATIFPDPELKSKQVTDYYNRWVPVSYVAFEGTSALYKGKFNFDRIPSVVPLANMNRISLCHGTSLGCNVPLTLPIEQGLVNSCGKKALFLSPLIESWWARVEAATGSPKRTIYKCVIRREHPGVNIPATARWRWLAEDETEWQYCPNGCCEMQSKFSS